MSNGIDARGKRGWERYDEKKIIKDNNSTAPKKLGLGKSYSVCIAGAAGWAMMQLTGFLLVTFGLAEGELWWLTVSVNAVKWAAMLVFSLGIFFVWRNASPERRQPLGRVVPIATILTVACSVFRIAVLRASYGGFNTTGKAVLLVLLAVMLLEYRKKPPFVENLWKYSGVTATFCYVAAALMGIMMMTLQLLAYSTMQYVFAFSFYGAEVLELVSVVMLAVYYGGRKRLVRNRFASET